MRALAPDKGNRRAVARRAARRKRPLALAKLELKLRRKAREVKRGLARAKRAVEETRDRIEVDIRETADEVKRGLDKAKRAVAQTRDKIEGEVRETADEMRRAVADAKRRAEATRVKLGDEARFIRSWIENPLAAGAVTPSSPQLARRMAEQVDPALPGPVIELGPGTGPVTEALVARGIAPERLVLVEYDGDFCRLLGARFPGATIIQGDAYGLTDTIGQRLAGARAAAVVSSLPLMTRPREQRLGLLTQAFALLMPAAPFVQFTYAVGSPIPLNVGGFTAMAANRVWRNVPPARVWVYRATGG